jgi:molecular chaperone GrpE
VDAPNGATEDVERLQGEVRDLQDQLLRRAAEFQNYRRRTEAELSGARRDGHAEAALAMIDVYDDLRRSLDAATAAMEANPEAGAEPHFEGLRDGVELVYRKFGDALGALGIQEISAVGQKFDESVHEAVLQQPATAEAPSGTVIAELQRGYMIGDRVLRHARVVVAV